MAPDAQMRAAAWQLRTEPAKTGVPAHLAEILADGLQYSADDYAGAARYAKDHGGDPFELVDEPGSVRRALVLAKAITEADTR